MTSYLLLYVALCSRLDSTQDLYLESLVNHKVIRHKYMTLLCTYIVMSYTESKVIIDIVRLFIVYSALTQVSFLHALAGRPIVYFMVGA